ncbi:MAG: PAS domain S-box protein [Proteobacteria bacterium]|nr:PAS domain S-box protein [Pseudomonadota bacterium]
MNRSQAVSLLERAGFRDVVSRAVFGFDDESPQLDLIVVAGSAVGDLCAQAREVPTLAGVPIVAITDDVAGAIAAGATDVLSPTDPSAAAVARERLRRLIEDGRSRREAELLAYLHEAMAGIFDLGVHDEGAGALREALLVAIDVMGFARASVIAHLMGSETAYVIAATDDPTLYQFALLIENYPEIEASLDRCEPVLIADVLNDPLTQPIAAMLESTEVRAIAVFPVVWQERPLGVVMFRKSLPGLHQLDGHRLRFGAMFARYMGFCLRHGQVLESLRDQTQRISRARYEAERRLRTIESLKEYFEAAADGVIVLEQSGRILFVNSTAENITGFARNGLIGSDIGVLAADSQRDVIREVIEQVISGHNIEAFDLSLRTTSGEPMWASVTTSTVISSSGAAILSFRDVTAQRALEAELRKTKEFLEKLVDSTVDAIVAADMRGNVIIFNQGAERMFGYSARQVIGRIQVWELYAEGVPKQVMRMLRSTQYGGVGRLEQTRREILNNQGDLVPVNMTASIIYENGREVATVGIFADLRDRIRIEQRLLRAQEKLKLTEKQAVVAELAGAAAHELNQPLQAITSYAEMIQRQCSTKASYSRAIEEVLPHVEVILVQAERMADIVKQIGQSTRYETTDYPGQRQIIDIRRSSSPGYRLPVDGDAEEITNQVDVEAMPRGQARKKSDERSDSGDEGHGDRDDTGDEGDQWENSSRGHRSARAGTARADVGPVLVRSHGATSELSIVGEDSDSEGKSG